MSPHSFMIQLISHSARSFSLLVPQQGAWQLKARPPVQLFNVLEPAGNQHSVERSTGMWSSWASEDLIGQEEDPEVTWCISTSQHSNETHWCSIYRLCSSNAGMLSCWSYYNCPMVSNRCWRPRCPAPKQFHQLLEVLGILAQSSSPPQRVTVPGARL